MTCRKFCIVIALMVLSISALLVANPNILGEFSSTLNGVPVEVIISRQGNGTITTMPMEDLLKNWADNDKQFVRFMGTVKSVDWSSPKKVVLTLAEWDDYKVGVDLFVHPLDAPHLPMEYQEGHVYEFTGFLTGPDSDDIPDLDAHGGWVSTAILVYAFEIRHHGETKSDSEESDPSPDEDANPKDGTDSQGEME